MAFPDGSLYVGASATVSKRIQTQKANMHRGNAPRTLQAAYNAYGFPQFILGDYCTRDELPALEMAWIEALRPELNSQINNAGSLRNHKRLTVLE